MKRASAKSILASVIVVFAVVCLGAFIRWFVWARTTSSYSACINNLRQIDGAIQQWALEHRAASNYVVTWSDIRPYLGRGQSVELPNCPQGGKYTIGRVADAPRCTIMHHNLGFGSVVVADESGLPLSGVRVAVVGRNGEICNAHTSTNGEAYLFADWRSGLYENVVTNSWSDGTKKIVAVKPGYQAAIVALPTNAWPLNFVLKRESQ
jgi:hypothetical protein